jgi:hypothetical protein
MVVRSTIIDEYRRSTIPFSECYWGVYPKYLKYASADTKVRTRTAAVDPIPYSALKL